MEIVLLEDVKALGKKGQVVKVNDGYARNFILPKKLGVEATSKNLNDLKLQKANDAKIAAEQLAAAKELAEKLKKNRFTLQDYYDQLVQVKGMGSMDELLGMMPGLNAKALEGATINERRFPGQRLLFSL